MKTKSRILISALFFIVISCAVITVNIYFPEKDVKEAYKALEEELMTPEKNMNGKQPESKPESSIQFEFVSSAYAQASGLADKISQIVKRMPDVVQAYKEMGARISLTDGLRDRGAVGEAKNGFLVIRGKGLSPDEKKIVDRENANRKTVMNGMAKAVIRINRDPETPDTLKQVMPQAVEQFASIRRDSAKKGWWIQNPDGNWIKK
jgi:uncharacterized protein YdbL (DUF1318 family)